MSTATMKAPPRLGRRSNAASHGTMEGDRLLERERGRLSGSGPAHHPTQMPAICRLFTSERFDASRGVGLVLARRAASGSQASSRYLRQRRGCDGAFRDPACLPACLRSVCQTRGATAVLWTVCQHYWPRGTAPAERAMLHCEGRPEMPRRRATAEGVGRVEQAMTGWGQHSTRQTAESPSATPTLEPHDRCSGELDTAGSITPACAEGAWMPRPSRWQQRVRS